MGNSRSFRRRLVDMLSPLDGARIPGGCPDCDAYQTTQPVSAGVWMIHVHHDNRCPSFTQRRDPQL
jgi:hypothetical protein